MIYVKIIVTLILFFYFCYRIGIVFHCKKRRNHLTDVILYGAIFFFACFQIIGQICIITHQNSKVPCYFTVILLFVTMIVSFQKRGLDDTRYYIKRYRYFTKKKKCLRKWIAIMMIGIAIVCSYLFNENADDGFYISLINMNTDSNQIYPNIEPSLGYGSDAQLRRYEIASYELFVSVLCQLTNISPSIMCHSVLPFLFIILSYSAYYLLFRTISKKNQFSLKVLVIFTVLLLFEGYSRWSIGITLFSKMWQGKAIFLNLVLPVVWSNLLKITFQKHYKTEILWLFFTNVAGIFFTPVALFLITFSYIGFCLYLLLKRKIPKIFYLFLTGMPVLLSSILMLILTKEGGTGQYVPVNILSLWKEYLGEGNYFYLYMIACIVLLGIGNKRVKFFSMGIPMMYLFTIYNPFFSNIIAKYLTGSAVFWRVMWLFPMEITIAYVMTLLIEKSSTFFLKIGMNFICLFVILWSGTFCFQKKNGFEIPENLEKIPQSIIEQTDYILSDYKGEDKPIVLCPPEPLHSVTIRQLTADIKIFWSRDFYMLDLFGREEYDQMLKLYQCYFDQKIILEKETFKELIQKYEIDYMIVPKEYEQITRYMEQLDCLTEVEIQEDIIYRF